MKVIAIKDAPVTGRYWPDGSKQADREGDVFEVDMQNTDGTLWSEVDDATKKFLVVWHPTIGKLEVTAENFEDLEKWRSKRIDNILEDGDN